MVNTLSLFDGMACGALALQGQGIPIDSYNAFEIDKYAIKTALHNFPFIKQHGDVFQADFSKFEGVDLVCGGSPCTYWSIAQKNNRETEASGLGWELFSQYAKAVKEARPKYFLYENNKSMSNAIRDSISDTFGFEPICINSSLVSAQNRQRLYWVGVRKSNGNYTKIKVEQPADKGILLRDILESGVVDKEKAYCLKHQAGNARDYLKKHHTQVAFEPVEIDGDTPINPLASGKARCVTAAYANKGVKHIFESNYSDNPHKQQWDSIAEPIRIGDIGSNSRAHRVYSCDGKSVTINAGGGGQGGKTGLYMCPADGSDKRIPIYEVHNGLITHNGRQYPIKLKDGFYIIRKLTVRECMRLQTIPEWYHFPVSDTQAYKLIGNGWTVEVIKWLLSYMCF